MTNSKRTIGKLAAEAGVGIETIRYYERRGLLQQPKLNRTSEETPDMSFGMQWMS
jgi:MerR family mercuric resistance operon transcriptional regulator